MILGVAECECMIYNAQSLKEKRAVMQRILTRLKQKYNVSVSETGHQDVWQRTQIAIAAVGSHRVSVERELQNSLKLIDSFPEIERMITDIDWF